MVALSKADALAALSGIQRKTLEVEADELAEGATLIVQEPTASQRDSYYANVFPEINAGESSVENRTIKVEVNNNQKYSLLPFAIVDEDGKTIFNRKHIESFPPTLTDRLWDAWTTLANDVGEGKDDA